VNLDQGIEKVEIPMRMNIVSETYHNYQQGALSDQLTDIGRGRECVVDDNEYVDK
jgi:hypothetical protein